MRVEAMLLDVTRDEMVLQVLENIRLTFRVLPASHCTASLSLSY